MCLTVSIVTYHTDPDELRLCLESLTSDVVDAIYIVDNSAMDGDTRVRVSVRDNPKVIYIPNKNTGYGSAHNIAIRLAMEGGARYHLVLNSDVRFEPEVLPRLISVMEARPGTGQLQPRIEYPDGKLQYTVRRLPAPVDVFVRRFLPETWIRRRNNRYLYKDKDLSEEFNPPYHQGSFMLLRVDALRKVGLFDERFFMYPEDIDLTRRMHREYKTLYYPKERIVHDHRAGSYHSFRLLWIHCVNMMRYFNKWGWFCDSERREWNRE